MIVCLCHRVSDHDITRAAREGTACFDQLQDDTCVAMGCGCCLDCAVETFEAARSALTPGRPAGTHRVGAAIAPA
jgi:bacterioferritin-associated ferredoxin